LAALARELPGQARVQGESVMVNDARVFTDLLAATPQELPTAAQAAWLACLVRCGGAVQARAAESGWELKPHSAAALPKDWLAGDIEQLLAAVAGA
jgi:hypothetical protein